MRIRMRALRELLVRRLLPPLALQIYRGAGRSWRYTTHHPERYAAARASGLPLIGAFLHARTFPSLYYFSRPGRGRWLLMCSKSRDGDAIAYIEERLGFQLVRGSSGSGGARALVALIKRQRAEPDLMVGLSIDGSRGPRGIAQAGSLLLAQKTGGLIVPLAASTKHSWVYKRSWDRIVVPLPFADIHMDFGEPIAVPAGADEVQLERIRIQLEESVVGLNSALDLHTGFADTESLRKPVSVATPEWLEAES
jgi:lysophospholipid acyltransferase (LPLAT)-like uncharacterized protein